jgi:predicted phage terminase large subunit-like protein
MGMIRFWDLAATENAGDFTVGVKMLKHSRGIYYVLHVVRGRWRSMQRDATILQTAQMDGTEVAIWIEEEGGSAGKMQSDALIRMLAGFNVHTERPTGPKLVRALPLAAQAEAGNVKLLAGAWNQAFIDELHAFTGEDGDCDDQVDAASGAFNKLVQFAPLDMWSPGNGSNGESGHGIETPADILRNWPVGGRM